MIWKEKEEGCSRRTFMKGAAATAAAVSLAGCSKSDDNETYEPGKAGNAPDLREVRKVYSACPVECLTHSLNCQLVGDEVVRVEPTRKPDDIYFTTACARGMSRMQFLTENRVLTPMKRIKKGTETSPLGVVLKNNAIDEWVSISWEQAIKEIGEKLKQLKADNEKGIMLWTGSGNMGPIVNTLLVNFFNHISPDRTSKLGNSCCAGVDAGMVPVYGKRGIDTRDTIRYSKCIINWGNNPAETSNTYWKFVIDAKLAGAKIITIDPRYSGSAEKSDMWVPIKPGTDVLFGIGMLRHIFQSDVTGGGDKTWIDTNMLKYRSNAPYLVDISKIVNKDGSLIEKAYNKLFEVSIKTVDVVGADGKTTQKKPLIWDGTAGVPAEENKGRGKNTQEPDLYYTNKTDKVTTVYQLMRALYAGDILTAGEGAVPEPLRTLHDPNYRDEAGTEGEVRYSSISDVTGASKATIEAVAEAYASSNNNYDSDGIPVRKSMIIENMGGGQRNEHAGHECAMHCILSVITGNVGGRGNGVDDTSGWSSAASGLQTGDIAAPGTAIPGLKNAKVTGTHDIPFGVLGRRALAAAKGRPFATYKKKDNNAAEDPVIKFWYLASSNLLTQFPNTDMLKEALRYSECVVTAKPTWSTDADYSDYYLPVTTPFEYDDIGAANRNKYIHLMEAGVKPYGQARSDMQILRDLAKVVFDDPEIIANFDHDDDYYPKAIVENDANNMKVNGLNSYEDLKAKKTVRPEAYPLPFVPLHNLEFKNDLNRAHIFIPDWNMDTGKVSDCKSNIDRSPNPARDLFRGPFPRYVPALQSHLAWLSDFPWLGKGKLSNVPLDIDQDYKDIRDKYPLCNVQFKTLRTVHASFTGLPWIREAFGDRGIVIMNTKDALEYGISDGDIVTVRSWIGAVERVAKVTDNIMKGVTAIENGWWDKFGKVSSSTVGVELPGALNNAHTHNNTLVKITKGGMN